MIFHDHGNPVEYVTPNTLVRRCIINVIQMFCGLLGYIFSEAKKNIIIFFQPVIAAICESEVFININICVFIIRLSGLKYELCDRWWET